MVVGSEQFRGIVALNHMRTSCRRVFRKIRDFALPLFHQSTITRPYVAAPYDYLSHVGRSLGTTRMRFRRVILHAAAPMTI